MDNARGEAREALGDAKDAAYGAMWNPTVIRPLSRKMLLSGLRLASIRIYLPRP